MGYRDIVVHFENTAAGAKRLDVAASVAQNHDAQLTGLVLDRAPFYPVFVDGVVPANVIEELEDMARERTEAELAVLKRLLAGYNVPAEQRAVRYSNGDLGSVMARQSRCADLLVLGQPDPEGTVLSDRAFGEILLSSGRPVLVIPFIGAESTIGERILIAWNGGREAARAVADALPLLERAKQVVVMTVNASEENGDETPDVDIALHLARHGVRVELRRAIATDLNAADVLLNEASDHEADLIVMGAYGHSRMREFVFGGMTRSMLDQMTVPVLMSH